MGKGLDSLTYCQCSILMKQHGSKKISVLCNSDNLINYLNL